MRQRLALALVVAAATLGLAATPIDSAALVGHAAVVVAAIATTVERRRGALAAGGGVLAAATFVLRPGAWIATTTTLALGLIAVAMLPSWRGELRDGRRLARDAAAMIGVALSLPIALAIVAAFAGTLPTLLRELATALPPRPIMALGVAATEVVVVVLLLDGVRAGRPAARHVEGVCACAIAALVALRVAWIVSVARLPTEVFWPEAPLLVNALKLDAGETLYGPPADLSSYTYSPMLDVVHHAVLKLLHAELSIHAHRAIVVFEEIAAIAILVWALRRRLTIAALIAIAFAALANLLAPALHPDHALLMCFAIAIALLVAEDRVPRAVWWTALVVLTPIAASFKLSGAGIGVGLAAAFAPEKRWRAIGALAASAALTLAMFPLFDATLGAFRFYAVGVQASHPIVWSRLVELPTTPVGLAAIAATALGVWMRRSAASVAGKDTRRVALLTTFVALASLPAYAKYGGRDNNVALFLLGVIVTALLRARDRAERAPHGALVPAAALLATIVFRPPVAPPSAAERAAAIADFDRAVAAVRDADERGAHALLLVHSTAWIAAGHRDVPRDRFHSAVELFFARRPEADLLFSHVEDGRYDTLVLTGAQLRPRSDALGDFSARLRTSIERHYDLTYPADARAVDDVDGLLVFRRRPTP